MNTRKMIFMTMFVAIAVAGSAFISFPAGIARAYPIQHAVNVIVAIIMGPGAAVIVAFLTGLVRVLTGTGSLLAFPGGMIGAFLAGVLYHKIKKRWSAGIGEVIGTGFIAPLFAVPYAKILMGTTVTTFFFLPPFLVSTVSGTIIGLLLAPRLLKLKVFRDLH
ncbi:energy coupling factor transporter S component ThiW [Sporosarcina obsidiansis]|uniref:energy coupling factor transporter S component ThiW n=1 Tax=Sporosarcina obsidiansis TaxID=2660748 RepID=UPI00129B51B8|nr:energy coupling factor transporter S component ThiW [Sporosarcina obsidiansis]